MEQCKANTMVCQRHLEYLEQIITEVNLSGIDGSIVECGVWKGGCCMWMMLCQQKFGENRPFFLYDTFDGMTYPANDKDAGEAKTIFNRISDKLYKRDYDKWHNENKWAYAPLELVQANIHSTNYDASKISYVKGDINMTLDTTVPTSIAVLRLDTDWYDSTKKELTMLFPLVVKGGYIIVDDYYAWKGSRVATDEFMNIHRDKVSIVDKNITGGHFVLKKTSPV